MKSLWCRVVDDRYDVVLGPNRLMTGVKGDIRMIPEALALQGISEGKLELTKRPAGKRVTIWGQVLE